MHILKNTPVVQNWMPAIRRYLPPDFMVTHAALHLFVICSFNRSKNIGLGNGQRKSCEFEDFVLEKRKHLRNDLKFCERATQRVLLYSNNFLHKKLKTDPSVSGYQHVKINERVKAKGLFGWYRLQSRWS